MTAAPTLRQRTVLGERAMREAEEEGLVLIDTHADEIVRGYVATGLLSAALTELRSGVPRETAVQTLREVLRLLDPPAS